MNGHLRRCRCAPVLAPPCIWPFLNRLLKWRKVRASGRREGGGCKAEQGVAPGAYWVVREDANPKRQRSRRCLIDGSENTWRVLQA